MEWAPSLEAAVRRAEEMLGNPGADVTIIPDGVGVIVEPGKFRRFKCAWGIQYKKTGPAEGWLGGLGAKPAPKSLINAARKANAV